MVAMVSAPIERENQDRAGAREVKRLIKQATLFLIFWLFGIGSIIAVLNGLKARKLIAASDGRIEGIVGAWVCITIGFVQMGIWIKFISTGSFL
jgi:uncharacterized RDD family membrane protein YckC